MTHTPSTTPRPWYPLITCEHASNRVPAAYRTLFANHETLLDSHRGWDPGALPLARRLARKLGAPLHVGRVTRLLVELNRNLHHPDLFSDISRQLDTRRRQQVLEKHYLPYRQAVQQAVATAIRSNHRVLHISVHTFTPHLHGQTRFADVGLLYDPARLGERLLCRRWRERIETAWPNLRVQMNQPYRGTSDGLTRWLRQQWPDARYAGIELEVNQRFVSQTTGWQRVCRELTRSLAQVVAHGLKTL